MIKADENPVAIRRALHPPVRLPQMFAEVPQPKPTSSTTAATETKRPPQMDTKRETGPTTTSTIVIEVVPMRPQAADMFYMSAESIQAQVQRY